MAIVWRNFVSVIIGALLLVFVVGSVRADTPMTDRWFLQATSYNAHGVAQTMSHPDFICGKSFETLNCGLTLCKSVGFYAVWDLLLYDRKHHIALAHGTTDQESFALFSAPPPPVAVSNADLSHWTTARGVQIGSPYSKVLSLYGGTPKHGPRFVAIYTAIFPAFEKPMNRHETLHEIVTLVITEYRVSSISIYIACCSG